jgi:hypothetical protein
MGSSPSGTIQQGMDTQRARLRREEQNILRISSLRSRQLKVKQMSLMIQGQSKPSMTFPTQAIGMIQREDLADSKLPAPICNLG